jgi:hypothetical protein
MVTRYLVCASAVLASIIVPGTARAQCGYVPCVAYLYAPQIAAMTARMGASPGWFAGARQAMGPIGPARYPPTAVWRPQVRYAGPPAFRSPGVWVVRRR